MVTVASSLPGRAGALQRARLLLLAFLVLLGGCSSTTFIYNRLDFIVPWYLDDYVELNREQDRYLDQLLQPYLYWHRMEELPRYIELIERIESDLDSPLEVGSLQQVQAEFEAAWARLEQRSVEWMMALGDQLSEEQVAQFMSRLREQQQEYEEEYLERSEREYHEDAYDNLQDSARDYLGRLDKGQKQLLRDGADQLLRSDSAWLLERALWLDRLEHILQRQPGWQQALRDAMAAREEQVSPEYLEVYGHNVAMIQGVIVELLNGRSERQDRRLRSKLAQLREDLQSLVEQGREQGPPTGAESLVQ